MTTRAYIGLGSNLDAPAEQLQNAFQALGQAEGTRLVAVSGLFTSDSLLPGQPRHTNAVAALDTSLEP
ncbi:2-amino-4-hydroxy-6-hydroxymethyldihydropteridine diphosphokinase, partial [Paraburkholderia sp. SIMBA_049]